MTGSSGLSASRRAFTLLELLVSMAVMALLAVLLLSLIDSTSRIAQETRRSTESFQAARAAFETITDHLAQATLNTYYSYDNPAHPSYYRRQSELHFLSGQAGDLLPAGLLENQHFGHAVFFQYHGGFNPGQPAGKKTNLLRDLMNGCGYFVSFCAEDDPRLGLVPAIPGIAVPSNKYRYRLIEALQPAANLSVYKSTSGHQWITDLCLGTETQFGVLADDVILLAILPKFSPGDDTSGTALAPNFEYDSRDNRTVHATTQTGDSIKSSTLHQLPPQMEIVMIALDRASAQRVASGGGALAPDLGVGSSSNRFKDAAKLEADLAEVTKLLDGQRLKYRVFRTVIPIKGAKWSQEKNAS